VSESRLGREFQERGFVVLKSLLDPGLVEACVQRLEAVSGRTRASFGGYAAAGRGHSVAGGWTLPDGVSRRRELWELIFLAPLLAAVRDMLGPEARFLQHTDLHVGFSAVTWHRDSVQRRFGAHGDWNESREPYRLARVGFYLQHADSGFRLGLIPGSHRAGSLDAPTLRMLDRRTHPLRQGLAFLLGRDPVAGRAEHVPLEAGDAIVFDPRILHSGGAIRGPKFSAFLAYGVPSHHFARHLHYYRHVREDLGYRALDPDLVARLRQASLLADVDSLPHVDDTGAYRPGPLLRLLARRVRPALG
jgi:ectoine hydroxylase-related dioxygenase (phytanoyl-CoA dioxygenase family)